MNENTSKLSIYVDINLELYPGTSIPLSQQVSLSCQVKKNKILEILSMITGTEYRPSTMYVFEPDKIAKYYKNKGVEDNTKNKTRNNRNGRPNYNNGTRKQYQDQDQRRYQDQYQRRYQDQYQRRYQDQRQQRYQGQPRY